MPSPALNVSILISGFALAGGAGSLCYAWARQRWQPLTLFAWMSFVLAGYAFFTFLVQSTSTPQAALLSIRLIEICSCSFMLLLPLLYRQLCGQRYGWPEYLIAGFYLVAMFLALLRPAGYEWDRVSHMGLLDMREMGAVYFPEGKHSAIVLPIRIGHLLVLCYCLGIALRGWRGGHNGLLAVLVLPLSLCGIVLFALGDAVGLWHFTFDVAEWSATALYFGLVACIFREERHDMDDRLRTQETLRQSQRQMQDIEANMPGVIYQLFARDTGELRMTYVSPRSLEVLGLECRLEGYFERFVACIVEEDRVRFVESVQRAVREVENWEFEGRFRKPSGKIIYLRGQSIPQRHDETIVFNGLLTDITERKSLEAQLLHSQKMEAVGRLAGGVAHDFNNLLTVIRGYGELLQLDLPKESDLLVNTERIVEAADRAAGLTHQLLAFSRKQVEQPKLLDSAEVLRSLEPLMRRLIGEDIELSIVSGIETGTIRADPTQMEQMLLNLAINARDAMPTGGKLTLEVLPLDLDVDLSRPSLHVPAGRYVVFSVQDTGCGMDEETLSYIFEPFFTTKDPEKGTGLGLATVYSIVAQSHGYISVKSEPGKGTRFEVYLPRLDVAPTKPVSSLQKAADWLGSETILVAEDDVSIRDLVGDFLREHGYTVLQADGETFAHVSAEYMGEIDLLVADVVMPGKSGRQVAELLARSRPGIKVLFMSGYTDDAIMRHGILAEETFFLQKPFTLDGLLFKVREVLGK